MASGRVTRGRQTEEMVARFLREAGLQYAERRPASLPGSDVMGLPGVDIEVKARNDWTPTTWLAQQRKRTNDDDLRLVVYRPDGYGEAKIRLWPVVMSFGDFIDAWGEILL